DIPSNWRADAEIQGRTKCPNDNALSCHSIFNRRSHFGVMAGILQHLLHHLKPCADNALRPIRAETRVSLYLALTISLAKLPANSRKYILGLMKIISTRRPFIHFAAAVRSQISS